MQGDDSEGMILDLYQCVLDAVDALAAEPMRRVSGRVLQSRAIT